MNNKDHDLLIQYISQGTSTSAKKYHRRSINPVFLLPYSFIERVSQEAIDQLIADKERDEKYNDLCKRYRKFLGQFLKLHPELKEKSQILEAEEALKAFIEENKKQWAYDDWKESQQEFTHTVSMKASTVFPNSHVLVRNAPLKNIGNGMETTDDQVTVCQVALCEYSDPVSEDQSAEDRQRNAWVKGLSFCNAKYDHAVTKQLFDFIKQDNANDNEILIVEVKDNFLGWDSKTISFHYASFDTALDRIDHCGVDELEETLAGRKKYKYVVVFDLISDEQQVDNVCKSILSCYTEEMPLFLYVSLVRKLTEDETKERNALTEKGVYYALGINGFKENKIKAKHCLFKADSQIAKYNLASMMACGFLDMGQYSIPMLLAEAKGMKHVEIIKKNYVETNYFSEE